MPTPEPQPTTIAGWLAVAPHLRDLLDAIPSDATRARGLSDADLIGLVQAYIRAIDRIAAAEVNITARLLTGIAPAMRARWADRWVRDLLPAAPATFQAMHAARLTPRVERIVSLPGDPNAGPRSVAFVDLRGSTAYMAEHDGSAIRALVDGMFLAAQHVADQHDVVIAKHLGDGVMLMGLDPAEMYAAGRTALRLIEEMTPLTAGVGIDFGPITTRAGDYFGTPVNCASRLAELARPNEIVLTRDAVPEPVPAGVWSDVPIRGLRHPARTLTVRDW